ncbi:undecaprenyldiphospho-muramoylpentapeptide beta-N-acetylglucosaminyltransferase [Alkalihalobacillus sp. LMS39]|uniref:undecaprenyldiphospho-muramoylpentapeptide beta-N-acetylglucosaminyltransferase n=1 Tax=Alkalihalobacillus sp. LMS39 TaxID=2924032 RepID=UPI001FB34171|nr:undecaprenyldiphospho-muramoylpentapeptide beta-N-acetylglucosaminyltransferase [Alkalihalobacillus sp. LMS39]UOE92928.1 undecaprenyldiphospho-muramoylpentapeptide beta-N-acetylglucosaminyltransferase [Alkalihalobacillus sp. LMS39]
MRVIVSGGGTGGHIYPALSLIKEMQKQRKVEVLYIGTEKGLESELVPREGIEFQSIEITGFKRSISLENIKTISRFFQGTKKAKRIMKQFKPDVVIGTGGYVCGPVVYAAAKLKIPTVIHEQNSVPGLTNKFLSRYVDKIALSFEEAKSLFPVKKTEMIGNPRAQEVVNTNAINIETFGLEKGKRTILIVGGSRGAKPINDAFLEVLPNMKESPFQFLYVTGQVHYEHVINEVKKHGDPNNVVVQPFLHNMPEVLAAVDLIVARAGATTLAEITALGLPSILIPSPYVTNNHQEKNANALASNGAAIVRLENQMSGETLMQDISTICSDTTKWEEMHQAAKALGRPQAATDLYNVVSKLVKEE